MKEKIIKVREVYLDQASNLLYAIQRDFKNDKSIGEVDKLHSKLKGLINDFFDYEKTL